MGLQPLSTVKETYLRRLAGTGMLAIMFATAASLPAYAQANCTDAVLRTERAWTGRLADFLRQYPATAMTLLACGGAAAQETVPERQIGTFMGCAAIPCLLVIGVSACSTAAIEAVQLAIERNQIDVQKQECRRPT